MFNFFKKDKEEVVEERKVKEPTDYTDVSKIAHYFKNETGVDFDNQTSILKNKVITFCKKRDITSFSSLLTLINSDALIKQEFIDSLTTNETFFYREFKQIEELVELVNSSTGNVDILCAPSATGEEPYSIVIALLESGVLPSKFKVVGIDINLEALQKAEKAVYKERNLRNLTDEIKDKYFDNDANLYVLKSSVKSHVTFKLENIFDASFKNIGKFDFILSRNMFIYFDTPTKIKAKNILESMMKNQSQEIFFGHADQF